MSEVVHVRAADSPGYTRITLADKIGTTQAAELVTAVAGDVTQEIAIGGQREFDVLEGATVAFPDGTTWEPESPKGK